MKRRKWIIVQNGSREHYAIPRMFHKNKELFIFITDIWINPNNLINRVLLRVFPKLKNRYHNELAGAQIKHWTFLFLFFEFLNRFLKVKFNRDRLCEGLFSSYINRLNNNESEQIIVFSYNYIAHKIFKIAKNKGFYCVLGQIDAGPKAGQINQLLYKEYFNGALKPNPDLYSTQFLDSWINACRYADKIVVNSKWSAKLITEFNFIDSNKVIIIPVAFEKDVKSTNFTRSYPDYFSFQRPLRILFVGSVKPLKGIIPLFEAIHELKMYPIEFYFIGGIQIPQDIINQLPNNAKMLGKLNYIQIEEYYKFCDVLILPTFSDGFAIVQLEAQSWKMPLIVSKRCGEVVTHMQNGLVIDDINKNEIINSIIYIFQNPSELLRFSQNSIDLENYSLNKIYSYYSNVL